MTFKHEEVNSFLTMFKEVKNEIKSFNGCEHLALWRDAHQPNIFMTYSIWEDNDKLDAYRKSVFFKSTWQRTKQWFSEKPIAYSSYEEVEI